MTLTHDPIWSLQTLKTPAAGTHTDLPMEGGGLTPVLPLTGPLIREGSPDHAMVHDLWRSQVESPLQGSLIAAGFPTPMSGNSATLRHLSLPVIPGFLRPDCPI